MKQETFGWSISNTYEQLPKRFYSFAKNSAFPKPSLVIYNEDLAKQLGISEELKKLSDEQKSELFVGNTFLDGMRPISQAYAGHQFGYFTTLGDGRAILLAEQNTADGKTYDIQLKGSGQTPYSRGGDGKAVIGPMLREYLISEAMHGLNIATTRSLAVCLTGENVFRYEYLPGAVLVRVASSHLRVGTFEFAYLGDDSDVKALADYAIKRHYPYIQNDENPYQSLLREVIKKQANLIAKWQLVGFIHGVMNTDNMSICGESIDYGPCAFMDKYDPKTVFSSIDRHSRYSYEHQPPIGHWNLSVFADALLPILDENQDKAIKIAEDELAKYLPIFKDAFLSGMREKLGLIKEQENDEVLVSELLNLMYKNGSDYTNTFVRLSLEVGEQDGSYLQGTSELFNDIEFKKWQEKWHESIEISEQNMQKAYEMMKNANPFVIPRNHLVESALSNATKGDYKEFNELLKVLQKPYEYDFKNSKYQELPSVSMAAYKTFCGT
ncbi:protein adenylyltransferase SelO [Campylobacter pinnipediorum]|uniref:protein adenylyltransferase SelO n=1 Tax=Campylobacter pinnipediorum TaxID=1965231 RepID=UPI00084D9C30|nr:YdiU family protein [Campylobacter pinnipediorum]